MRACGRVGVGVLASPLLPRKIWCPQALLLIAHMLACLVLLPAGTAAKHPSVAGTWMATLLSSLRPLLYALTLLSAAVKVQLPQAAVLHWTTTSSFTLALQLGLRSPRVRQLLGYNTQPGALGSSGSASVDPGVATQAAAVDNADVLVVMGAKHAALHHYNEALHCLGRALQLDPHNARCVCMCACRGQAMMKGRGVFQLT